jgi:hypothetical protein
LLCVKHHLKIFFNTKKKLSHIIGGIPTSGWDIDINKKFDDIIQGSLPTALWTILCLLETVFICVIYLKHSNSNLFTAYA